MGGRDAGPPPLADEYLPGASGPGGSTTAVTGAIVGVVAAAAGWAIGVPDGGAGLRALHAVFLGSGSGLAAGLLAALSLDVTRVSRARRDLTGREAQGWATRLWQAVRSKEGPRRSGLTPQELIGDWRTGWERRSRMALTACCILPLLGFAAFATRVTAGSVVNLSFAEVGGVGLILSIVAVALSAGFIWQAGQWAAVLETWARTAAERNNESTAKEAHVPTTDTARSETDRRTTPQRTELAKQTEHENPVETLAAAPLPIRPIASSGPIDATGPGEGVTGRPTQLADQDGAAGNSVPLSSPGTGSRRSTADADPND